MAIFFWGGNNVAVKYLVGRGHWPPIWIGCSRMFCVGLAMLGLLRWTTWFGSASRITPELKPRLWFQAGMSLALYVIAFTWALKLTSASHVALYLGSSPVWALLWEGRPDPNWNSFRRYGAAALALGGITVLFWPKLLLGGSDWLGDLLALCASVVWTYYSRECRRLGTRLSGAEITAQTMWRGALWLSPMALVELRTLGAPLRPAVIIVQAYSIVFGGIIGFALWNNALRHWRTSRVFLFNNLLPPATMAWAWVCIGEPVTSTFWLAMLLIAGGVVLGR
jgi:drug/metabolite transporter (DMT)-like permease